jgi:hypothetical protein
LALQAGGLNQIRALRTFRRRESALETQIQFHAGQLQRVRHQQLRLQPWRLDALPDEELAAFERKAM